MVDDPRAALYEMADHYVVARDRWRQYQETGHADLLLDACRLTCTALTKLTDEESFWSTVRAAAAAIDGQPLVTSTLHELELFAELERDLLKQTGRDDVARLVMIDLESAIDIVGLRPGPLEVEELRRSLRPFAASICAAEMALRAGGGALATGGPAMPISRARRFVVRGLRGLAGAVEAGFNAAVLVSVPITAPLAALQAASLVVGIDAMWTAVRPPHQ